MNSMRFTVLTLIMILLAPFCSHVNGQTRSTIGKRDLERKGEEENLQVFHQWLRWSNGGSFLAHHLVKQAFDLYKKRDQEIAKLKTPDDWSGRQRTVRGKLMSLLGPFPEKTPLNPVITGVIKADGYRIEKLVFESHPGFYVTACMYVPAQMRGRAPAVLNLIGHEQESFRAEIDQVMATNLVKKGMVVLTIDPLGQGEHLQYFDPQIKFSSIGYSVVEHCYFGNQCFLSGQSSAKYFIWDAIRAIDYLVSRKEVDADRIGVTGFSGGGTITSFVSALDDRVKVSIPSSWSTANRRQLETKGAQDAESTLVHSVAMGITFEDLIEVRAPKPTMMTFVSRDEYLTLQGAREAYAEAKKAYEAFTAEGNLVLVEDDSRHWLTPKIREAIFGFFMKHFGMTGDAAEEVVNIFPADELKVTATGQIGSSLGGDMVFDVNKRETGKLMDNLDQSRKDIAHHLNTVVEKAKDISGYQQPGEIGPAYINGRYQRDGYTVAKHAIHGEGDYVIPFLLFVPDVIRERNPAIIYLHPKGKISEALPGGAIERLVKKGFIVAAPDVIGVGETENAVAKGYVISYTAVLIGRSVVGLQAGDIVRVVNYLKSREEVDENNIGAVASGEMCLPLLHAAAFDPSIKNLTITGSLISYRTVAMNRLYSIGLTKRPGGGTHHPYDIDFTWGIAKVLTAYDLPDLVAAIAPRKVVLAGLVDQNLKPASDELIREEMRFPLEAYRSEDASSRIKIASETDAAALVAWAFE